MPGIGMRPVAWPPKSHKLLKVIWFAMGNRLQNGNSKIDEGVEQQVEFNAKDMIKIQKRSIYDDYVLYEIKGKGASAQVYRAALKAGKLERAVKVVRRSKESEGLSSEYMNEYTILKKLDHPNILKVYEIFEDNNRFYIVTEMCDGGELLDRILQKKYFTEADACSYFVQIMQTVSYIHEKHYMHRDLKPENLLFVDKTEKSGLKLIDFGSACYFENSQLCERKRVGTSYYIAPEVLQRRYNEKCDIWSCGVILFVLLSGETPFNGKDDNEILKNVAAGEYSYASKIWKAVSPQARDLVDRMLVKDPKQRLSAKQVLKHPWITMFNKEAKVGSVMVEDCLSNMRKFGSLKKIQEGVMMFIVNFLTSNQERERVRKIFRQIDTNGDGMISREEMRKAFEKSDNRDIMKDIAKFNALFDSIDKDKSGFVDYSEFLLATTNMETGLSEEKLECAFQLLDHDGSGAITTTELKSRLGQSIPEEVYQVLLKEFDKNNDGMISKKEFVEMMKRISLKSL